MVRLLVSSPVGQQVLAQLPAPLRARVDLALTTLGGPAAAAGPADRGLPQTPSGAFALRVRPEVVDLDERTSGLLGLPARQHRLTWAQVLERVHPQERAQVQAATLASLHKQASLNLRFRVVHDDGGEHWLSAVAHALTGEDGGTEQIVGFTMPSP
nr:PAS domain-containing protein [Kineococcus vitellinus]